MTKRAWGASIQSREEKAELKRRAVVQSAARLIRRIGYDALSLGDIAADLHVAKPTIYYYFKNKEEIVLDLMTSAVGAFLDTTAHAEDYPDAPGLSGAEAFERFIRRAVRVTSNDVGACLFVLYPHQIPDQIRRDIDTIAQPVAAWADRIVRTGLADGSIRACDPIVAFNWAVNGLRVLPILTELHRGTQSALADAIVDLVLNGIRAR
ncbi:MAG: TetR/AcrR family transcriptional regulator [Proteobacteria bacterium]|nr:TetR/AcrR family transcriptional regulator [Pseudomonadota bacterium]